MNEHTALHLLTQIKAYLTAGNPVWDVEDVGEAMDMAIEALKAEPIRCKDCKHYEELNYGAPEEGYCNSTAFYSDGFWTSADGYCYRAGRREPWRQRLVCAVAWRTLNAATARGTKRTSCCGYATQRYADATFSLSAEIRARRILSTE